jgi:hypothetical protein
MTSLTDIIASLRDILIDWNGAQLPDGAEPRSPPTCGDIAAVLDALEKAEADAKQYREAFEQNAAATANAVGGRLDLEEWITEAQIAMREIADTDPVDNMLDPQRPARIARKWLGEEKS